MHIPKKFRQESQTELHEAIRRYPFASLITYSQSGLEVNHIPFVLKEVDGKQLLQGHIARANPLWQNVDDQSEALVVFNGPNHYISPNYYPTKKATGKAVPTWNYISVNVKGTLSYVHDSAWLYNMIDELTQEHELGRPEPWSVKDAPENYIQKMLPAIVGLEIKISSLEGQWKLSQNQPTENKQGVIEGLLKENNSDANTMAALVKQHSNTSI
ncbi:MAG: FMN-binding negative transcriptional regulator [Cellvibrionaceae bacterium]